MEWFLRWGNWAVAKLVEALFNTSHLSDVGCSYRLFTREMADLIAAEMKIGGNHAGAEILLLDDHLRRPLRRDPRQLPAPGRHARLATGNLGAAISIGLRMILLILR